jgi:restriction system protein
MAIWLIRAGKHGEYEQKFIQEKRVYATWPDLNTDLSAMKKRTELFQAMTKLYPDDKPKAIHNYVGQV